MSLNFMNKGSDKMAIATANDVNPDQTALWAVISLSI